MFLIGSKGCGKSTFVDYLREVKLPPDIASDTLWIRLNVMHAPPDDLQSWIVEKITDGLKERGWP